MGTRGEVTHLTSITVCLTTQIALRDSHPVEDSPAVSHSLVTETLTFNGVLVILDVSLVTHRCVGSALRLQWRHQF